MGGCVGVLVPSLWDTLTSRVAIEGNRALDAGGGVFWDTTGTATTTCMLEDTSFSANFAAGYVVAGRGTSSCAPIDVACVTMRYVQASESPSYWTRQDVSHVSEPCVLREYSVRLSPLFVCGADNLQT